MLKQIKFHVLLLISFVSCSTLDTTKRGFVTSNAMVVSAHPLASKTGSDILLRGGNAIDAAIAVQFALAVVYPDAGNIGGGGFMVLRLNDGRTDALDFRETAPLNASRDMFLDKDSNVIKNLSEYGHLSAGVPGTVDGMVKAHKKYGSMPWNELIQPAIDLAYNGFPLTEKEAKKLNKYKNDFIRNSTVKPDFIIKERWKQGDTLRLPELANTLEMIRDSGRAGFYEGSIAKNIVDEMQRGGGLISFDDLKKYESIWRTPLTGKYKEYNIISMPPPSSGGIALIQLLTIAKDYPLKKWKWNSANTIHLMAEAEKRVYADRAKHLGDPVYYDVPVNGLLDTGYIKQRMADFLISNATPSKKINAGNPPKPESKETTHYSIIDQFGNAVSCTTTLNGSFGSKVFVAGSGFLLNNEMDDFSIKPDHPNKYGLVGGEANAIAPDKRMLSSMTPTILEKNGKLFMVVGSPGGSTIITSVFQTILNVTEHDFSMQAAVNAKRFHHQWKPAWIQTEWATINFSTGMKLIFKGHKIIPIGDIGRVDAVLVLPDGRLEGGADLRGDDYAAGF